MFRIEMLPAHHGDCLLLSYGEEARPRRILIDGGTPSSLPLLRKRLERIPAGERHFELLVITHIDDDHIGGVLKLLQQTDLGITWGDVWFNGWKHLIPQAPVPKLRGWLSARQGEDLSELLVRLDLPWNKAFDEATIVIPDSGPLPVLELPGKLRLTLLSPTRERLEKLDREWTDTLMRQGIIPGEAAAQARPTRRWLGGDIELAGYDLKTFRSDTSVANGSSIALLAEYEGRRCLLTGDAFAPVLAASLQRHPAFDERTGKLAVDATKLPHHGSSANISPDLLGLLSCGRYLISTNGDVFEHPDVEAVGRVITQGGSSAELFFNYRAETTRVWERASMQRRYGYRARYPDDADSGIVLDL
ncbi:ComEC/Rec2 family competence protein [Corallococcus exiguus]|uniref:ComEC/Rec2 family competence protein n=1 Tax=Corallococcus exiguus TaxID=83462 RepID=UPI003DA2CCE9